MGVCQSAIESAIESTIESASVMRKNIEKKEAYIWSLLEKKKMFPTRLGACSRDIIRRYFWWHVGCKWWMHPSQSLSPQRPC